MVYVDKVSKRSLFGKPLAKMTLSEFSNLSQKKAFITL